MSYLFEALLAKYPKVEFEVANGELIWRSTTVPAPTPEQVVQIVEEFKLTAPPEDQLALNWVDLRRVNYPSIEDQLDLIYHKGLDAWRAKIDEVKQKFPKQEPPKRPTPSTGSIPVSEV